MCWEQVRFHQVFTVDHKLVFIIICVILSSHFPIFSHLHRAVYKARGNTSSSIPTYLFIPFLPALLPLLSTPASPFILLLSLPISRATQRRKSSPLIFDCSPSRTCRVPHIAIVGIHTCPPPFRGKGPRPLPGGRRRWDAA